MLEGVDPDEVRRISEAVRGRLVWSGGIGTLEDLRVLRDMRLVNLVGVVSGKALYEGRFSVIDARAELESPPSPRNLPIG
jgi:phosphoribosylformimino-5-aminoimidazole carboxamide ribotide isomerase